MNHKNYSVKTTFTALLSRWNIPGIAWGALSMFVFFSILSPGKFLSFYNIMLILRHSCILLIASIGMALVILVSQVDLSIGSVVSLTAVITGVLLQNGFPVAIAVLAGYMFGLLVGLTNGFMVAICKFDYWISTFATMSIGAGLALVIAGGSTIPMANPVLNYLGNEKIAGIYVIIILTALIYVLMTFVLKKTRLGHNIYSIGGSENVAKVSGINVARYRVIVYLLSAFFASTAGLLLASMSNSASPIIGTEYSFNAMAAVIIGGISFDGGKGGIAGTLFGTLLLRILTNGLNIMGIPSTWQKTIVGVVIVVILVTEVLGEKAHKTRGLRRVYSDD